MAVTLTTIREDYPRVYGGTGLVHALEAIDEGLSPRVRGNLDDGPYLRAMHGGDYPRVYGGTCNGERTGNPLHGLSPRVRGEPPCPRPVRPP